MDFRSVSIEELRNRTEVPEDQAVSSVKAGEDSFAALFEGGEASRNFKVGEIVKGRVLSITKDYVVVDIGYKSEGQIPIGEFRDAEGKVTVDPRRRRRGLRRPGRVEDELVELSKDKAVNCASGSRSASLASVMSWCAGASSPASRVASPSTSASRPSSPAARWTSVPSGTSRSSSARSSTSRSSSSTSAGATSCCPAACSSRRSAPSSSRRPWSASRRAACCKGTVKNITEYGAFVDLGGIDGLLHITDMSWGRVNHPSEMVQVGDEIEVKVLKFNPDTERVSLGLKQISEDPWVHAEDKYRWATGSAARWSA
jgi:small subunit ribosomal protein S1